MRRSIIAMTLFAAITAALLLAPLGAYADMTIRLPDMTIITILRPIPNWQESGNIAKDFASGDGSEGSPYEIDSAEALALMARQVNGRKNADKHFRLTKDIDLAGKYWDPIGSYYYSPFSGTFDGEGHMISNMTTIHQWRTEETRETRSRVFNRMSHCGLFAVIKGGTVKNVSLVGINVLGYEFLGGLAGVN
ncbi:MAG: hypothetical protein LBS93_03775, partial [Synergistaceae bacterium]|nr:hypothetical protein [Synergistaceae bacterium]